MAQPGFMQYLQFFLISIVLAPMTSIFKLLGFVTKTRRVQDKNQDNEHFERVKKVQQQVLTWKSSGSKVPMCSARPSVKSISIMQALAYKDEMHQINIDLPNILDIDEARQVVRVEPMVTIGELNDFLIHRHWTLPIVPELDDLTIGGLVMGGGIEVTSHKYGFFQCICESYEMVLADGSLVICNRDDYPDLFATIPWSYGTLGLLVSVEIRIVPYKPYLDLTYVPVSSNNHAINLIQTETIRGHYDTIEGFMFSLGEGVIMLGKYVDIPAQDQPLNPIGRWYKPWFYEHARTSLKSGEFSENIPTIDFFHRHNKPIFWLMRYILPIANSLWFRYLFGWAFPISHEHINRLKLSLTDPKWFKNFVLQDYIVPIKHVQRVLELNEREFHIYPVWLCPTGHKDCNDFRKYGPNDILVDVGIYGFEEKRMERLTGQRILEDFTVENDGFVYLYAETDLSREQFDEMYRTYSTQYEEVRKRYDCEKAFPHVYHKISKLGRSNFCK